MSKEIAATQSAAPDVSVIVPVHNVAPWLVDCLSSILDQDVDHEVIVVDDGSTDDTWSIVGEFARRDPRVRAVRNIGKGGAQARNYGVELARGTYIAFADGDDIVPRHAYSAMLDAAREDEADMVVGGFFKFYTTRTWHPTESWSAWARRRSATTLDEHPSLIRNRACWNRLFRRDFWIGQNIVFPTVPRSNDVVPMTKALVAARRIAVLPETVYLYRNRPGSTSMSSRASGLASFESYLRQELASCVHVGSVGSLDLMREYDDLVIARDGWVHLRNFLRSLAVDDRVDDPDLGAALAEISSVIGELLSRLTDRMDKRADARTRWVWGLARAGRWAEAVRLVTDPVSVLVTEEPLAFPSPAGGKAVPVDEKDHRRVLSSLLVEATDPETPVSGETVERLAKHAGLFGRLYPASALHWHSAAVQLLVLAIQTGNADTVRAVLAQKPLKISEVQLTVRDKRAVLSATVSPVSLVSAIAAQTAQGTSRHQFASTVVDAHTGQIEAATEVGSLPVGRAFVRVRMQHELGAVDVVVSPTIAHDDRSRHVFRSETNRQVHINPGLAKRLLAGPRRGAHAAKSLLRRVVRP
ncbi:glycosyltransferase family 2 protein [Myceligenerans salitolerans]|uniref:Glycosyltransferase family 2 protein n=1 Tax=Myceligenerans salitolerans TaxID=1230528 RepID=A0ABS3I840_9MICO|nr:glycosyltransferase family 2 protein [Myceligenerans salitolerans]MBO0609176.1 glycosyltransferase family 2 protein [Myceligenerans salitolerans]